MLKTEDRSKNNDPLRWAKEMYFLGLWGLVLFPYPLVSLSLPRNQHYNSVLYIPHPCVKKRTGYTDLDSVSRVKDSGWRKIWPERFSRLKILDFTVDSEKLMQDTEKQINLISVISWLFFNRMEDGETWLR